MSDQDQPETETRAPTSVARARGFLLGLAALILLGDLLLAAVDGGPRGPQELEDADDVRRYLRATAEAERAPWLLLGDSVLVGDTGRQRLADWHEHRLIDYLRAELGTREQVEFRQAAFSGMLPVDMLAMVEELDAQDPGARVSLLVELSPRFFSPTYADEVAHSRPWFAELGAGAEGEAGWSRDRATRMARRWVPLYRHRERFGRTRELLEGPGEIASSGAEAGRLEGDRVEAFARLSVHYRDPQLAPSSVQVEALREIVRRCRSSGRRLALFAVPLEDRFIAGLGRSEGQGDYLARLDGVVEPDGRQVTLLPMDHPVFASEMFWDHVHLRPEGHRLLAVNLLHQLGLDLERMPNESELIGAVGPDASLVARVANGTSNGAAWQAKFADPRGVAVSADGAQVVVADTHNHVLRRLHGDLRVVSTLAGIPGQAGARDASAAIALLDRPRSPAFVGERLLFADGGGRRLRQLAAGEVTTAYSADDGWSIASLAGDRERLYMLESKAEASRILAYDVASGEAQPVLLGGSEASRRIVAFTPGPDGGLYVATATGRILHSRQRSRVIDLDASVGGSDLSVVYANEGGVVMPQHEDRMFPRPFEEILLSEIAQLVYVERYGGLLVQDLAPHPHEGAWGNRITERAHLRFLDLERGQVYPWVKPLVVGLGYAYSNEGTGGFSSYFHEGSMALHQGSATLVYLEQGRSRLIRVEDGMLGLAKTGSVGVERLGFRHAIAARAGKRALADHNPEDFLDGPAWATAELRGPYVMLVVGSSMISMSETAGEYSLGRQLIRRIERELALRDGARVHGFQRTKAGGRLTRQIEGIKSFMRSGGRPDIIVVESNASTFLDEGADLAFMDAQLERLTKLARRWDSKLVMIDTSPYIVRNREPPRPPLDRVTRFHELARARGVEVITVEDLVLDANLEVAPMASPPAIGIHPPPWAIDAIADELAAALVPIVRRSLQDRKPAVHALVAEPRSVARAEPLAKVFTEVESSWDEQLPTLPGAAVQIRSEDAHLVAFIDLAQLPAELAENPDVEGLILACVHEQAVRLRDGARTADITVGRFDRYDEYGSGVDEGATIVRREQLDYAGLTALARAFVARPAAEP